MDICALTTGLEWWLYLPRESGPPQERRFAVLRVSESPVEQLLEDFGAFLSREMLVNGQAERRAKAVRKASLEAAQLNKEIPAIWTQMLQKPDEELVELLSKRIYEKVNLRPTNPQVVAALRGSPIPSAGVSAERSIATSLPAHPQPDRDPRKPMPGAKKKTRRRSHRPAAIRLWGDRISISKHLEIVAKVADALHDRHPADFEHILELRGRKRPYVRTSSEGMHASRQISGTEYFVDVHGNAEALRRRAELLLEHFGHRASDLEILYD